jgi:hypothetical protein
LAQAFKPIDIDLRSQQKYKKTNILAVEAVIYSMIALTIYIVIPPFQNVQKSLLSMYDARNARLQCSDIDPLQNFSSNTSEVGSDTACFMDTSSRVSASLVPY